MAQIQPEPEQPGGIRRRRAARYVVPLGIAGLAAATIGLVPALAQSDDGPDLDKISAEDLVTKVLESKTQTVSGTVKIKTDLGLPSLPEGMGGGTDGGRALEMLTGDKTLQVAADGPNRQAVTLERDQGDYTAVHNGKDIWAYDSQKKEAFHGTNYSEKKGQKDGDHGLPEDLQDLTPREFAQEALKKADKTTEVTTDGTAMVAGQEAYVLKVAPKQDESTVRDIRIAVDADNGAPLKVTLTSDSGTKAIDAGFTKVDFGKPDAKQFEFTPPADAKVTEKDLSKEDGGDQGEKDRKDAERMMKDVEIEGSGWTSIAKFNAGAKLSDDGEGQSLLDSFTEKVDGGRVFSTDLINVLISDDGHVYAGAVTKDALVKAAND
ncbi:DUF2092 domain-containing protein [Streptomyces sp. A7024]|uniref:DUF2092 domain-containing protein n=1 Tax=Streptomyces coryli TaxID=1128680 RepID=A0A6G4UAA9_9ACTN|nr:DUF2092 domain-containing protein [Streptomyces coryli]NGN68942.1 DUF2092 domain-containing protein [Streptomyces coryli]